MNLGSADLMPVSVARAGCLASPSYSIPSQLLRGEIQLVCAPDEASSPPCISEWFMDRPSSAGEQGWEQYAQCRLRPRYDDWPTVEPIEIAGTATQTIADVARLLGSRRVTIIGASTAQQLFDWTQCALHREGLGSSGRHWRKWGTSTFASDNGRCQHLNASQILHSRCAERDGLFADEVLTESDVLIVDYSPEHYMQGGSVEQQRLALEWWRADLRTLLGLIGRWMALPPLHSSSPQHHHRNRAHRPMARAEAEPKRVAFLLEPAAVHHMVKSASHPCRCAPPGADDRHAPFRRALWQLAGGALHPIAVLPFFNATRHRPTMLKAGMCGYAWPRAMERRATWQRAQAALAAKAADSAARHPEGVLAGMHAEVATGARARGGGASFRAHRDCCDCLHYCYSPLFVDSAFVTPLYNALLMTSRAAGH